MGELTLRLSLRQEKGRKERKDGGRNEAEDSGMQNGGRKDMREDEEQGRRKNDAKYRIETKFGTSHRDFTRFTTF